MLGDGAPVAEAVLEDAVEQPGLGRSRSLDEVSPRFPEIVHALPEAHTCFFQLASPEFSSQAQMKKQLLTAMTWGLDDLDLK